jgi:hypothetical protein
LQDEIVAMPSSDLAGSRWLSVTSTISNRKVRGGGTSWAR